MIPPAELARRLRELAVQTETARSRKRVAASLRGFLAAMGEVKVKLVSTKPSEAEGADDTQFVQNWVITMSDGSKIETETDVGWGDEPIDVPHGSVEVEICGHHLTVSEILGVIISTGLGPVKDGEEQVLDAEWCSLVSKEGFLG